MCKTQVFVLFRLLKVSSLHFLYVFVLVVRTSYQLALKPEPRAPGNPVKIWVRRSSAGRHDEWSGRFQSRLPHPLGDAYLSEHIPFHFLVSRYNISFLLLLFFPRELTFSFVFCSLCRIQVEQQTPKIKWIRNGETQRKTEKEIGVCVLLTGTVDRLESIN